MKPALVLVFAVLALALAGCGGSEGSEAKGVAGSDRVEVEVDDNYFEPKVLEGSAGQRLTLELKSEGEAEHNLSIDAQQLDEDIEPGSSAEVTVTFPQSGQLTFYCKYHRASGMTGTLKTA